MIADGLESYGLLVDTVMFLLAVWTLILMAHIHCRGFICEQMMYFLQIFLQICPH